MALLDIVVEQYNICQEQARNTIGTVQDILIFAQNNVEEQIPLSAEQDFELGFGY
jgi:hypothetical protein